MIHVFFACAFSFFFLSFLKRTQFFFVSADADKSLSVAFFLQGPFLMAYRAAGIGMAGDGFFVSAFPILTDEQFSVFSVDFQHEFATFRTFGACHIVVAEGTVCRFDLLNESLLCNCRSLS